jgi:nitrogen fixation protein NifB
MNKETVESKIEKHPCYNRKAHDKYARIHLPVAPACNIQCNYCNRKYDCSNESRPGVTSGVLNPETALERVIMIKQQVENLSVVGIAGPGDALANPTATFQTLSLLKSYDPELIPCLSTNGLALPDNVDRIAEAGVSHVTVTLNAVDPEIGKKIYGWIHFEGKTYKGREAAEILFERQIAGIKKLVAKNILVKINTVLIPGINDNHIADIAKKIKKLGVFIHNILPLLSKPEYGTQFSKDNVPEPDIHTVAKARFDSAEIMGGFDKVMQHCRQCRADAIGKLGEDFEMDLISQEIKENSMVVKAQVINLHRASVLNHFNKKRNSIGTEKVLVAVATSRNSMADISFRNSRKFYIYEVSGWGTYLREIRTLDYGESEACIKLSGHLKKVADLLSDCSVVVCSLAGRQAVKGMRKKGIDVDTENGYRLLEDAAWQAGFEKLKKQAETA